MRPRVVTCSYRIGYRSRAAAMRGGTILNGSKVLQGLALAALLGAAGCGHKTESTVVPKASDVAEFDSAVRDGDTEIISRLLKAKPEMINAKDENGKTPV